MNVVPCVTRPRVAGKNHADQINRDCFPDFELRFIGAPCNRSMWWRLLHPLPLSRNPMPPGRSTESLFRVSQVWRVEFKTRRLTPMYDAIHISDPTDHQLRNSPGLLLKQFRQA